MERIMKRILVVLVLSSLLVSCSIELVQKTTGKEMKTVCLDGVTYYLFSEIGYSRGFGYMSVKLDRESKIIPCTE